MKRTPVTALACENLGRTPVSAMARRQGLKRADTTSREVTDDLLYLFTQGGCLIAYLVRNVKLVAEVLLCFSIFFAIKYH